MVITYKNYVNFIYMCRFPLNFVVFFHSNVFVSEVVEPVSPYDLLQGVQKNRSSYILLGTAWTVYFRHTGKSCKAIARLDNIYRTFKAPQFSITDALIKPWTSTGIFSGVNIIGGIHGTRTNEGAKTKIELLKV